MSHKTILWLRNDLRLSDNPALTHAAKLGEVIPVFILDDAAAGSWKIGGASRWWLHHSLHDLGNSLAQKHVKLVLKRGDSLALLQELLRETGATQLVWNRRYEPYGIEQDKTIKARLKEDGIEVQSFNAALLYEPWEVKNGSGSCYKVFTPFWKQCLAMDPPSAPLPVPKLTASNYEKYSDRLEDWKLLPTHPDWAGGLRDCWNVGETAAQERLQNFLDHGLPHYAQGRDFPADGYTSCLSPHLHHGEISPRQIWHAVQAQEAAKGPNTKNSKKFLAEIGWREFSYHLLYHFPHFPDDPFREEFAAFPWKEDEEAITRWQRGQTGYPIVDAGMRELWHTGIMHNRVRMIVASFLVKHLLQPWQVGERWFWDTLVDADLASNSASWQWTAGCGADAAPYFRIFNPIIQGKKFDPKGDYVRQWVPEVKHLPTNLIHTPWEYDEKIPNYPAPIVNHDEARKRAMAAYEEMKEENG
jgi:deoxyribodipyrimidine photo-lyase